MNDELITWEPISVLCAKRTKDKWPIDQKRTFVTPNHFPTQFYARKGIYIKKLGDFS